jgi:hypothetical protein
VTSDGTRIAAEALGEPTPGDRLVVRSLDGVARRRVEWVVDGLLPRRALTLVAGVGGLGKSTWLLAVAAVVSNGTLLGEPGDVVIVTLEDTLEEIVRPRLEAAGARLDRVHAIEVPLEVGQFELPLDLVELAEKVRARRAQLVVVDPITAAIDLNLDAHKDQDVRVVLAGLAKLTERANCATAFVGHLNKAPSSDVYLRVGGSVAFYNAARSVVLVTPDSEGSEEHRLITQAKANWSRRRPVQRHVLEEIVLDGAERDTAVRMRYVEDADDVDRDHVLADHRDRQNSDEKHSAAILFLVGTLDDGEWHDSAGLKTLAGARGIAERTLKRAAQELGVEYDSRGWPRSTWWRHPSRAMPPPPRDGPTGGSGANSHGYAESDRDKPQSGHGAKGDRDVARLDDAPAEQLGLDDAPAGSPRSNVDEGELERLADVARRFQQAEGDGEAQR